MKTGVLCFLIAIAALAGYVVHAFVVPDAETYYLTLPRELWTTVLLTLVVASFLEGIYRVRAAGADAY